MGEKDISLIKKAKTLSAYTEEDYDLPQEFASRNRFTSLLTTPHIITKVSNLLGKERDHIKRIGRESGVEFLARCSERSDSSVELASNPKFKRLDITDVAIPIVATSSVFVLTAGRTLYLNCLNLGHNVAHFNHVRQGAWS